MPAVFDQFIEKAPLCVMARITLESLFDDKRLDQLFDANRIGNPDNAISLDLRCHHPYTNA